MNLFSFTAFVILLILFVGFYLVLADEVSGTIKIILIVFLFFMGIYFLINLSLFKSYYEIVDVPIDASASFIYPASKFSAVDQVYTLSTWIYIDDWNSNFGLYKNIIDFKRSGETGVKANSTKIMLDQYENNLVIQYDVYTSASQAQTVVQTINVPNINIQKWVCITVCFNTNNTDTYINGKLIDTDVHTFPIYAPENTKTNTGALTLAPTPGFSGKIGLTRYYGRIITPQDVWNIYKKGPTTNLFGTFLNRYNASFKFYQDSKEVQEIYLM
jgi:hypothetical protein